MGKTAALNKDKVVHNKFTGKNTGVLITQFESSNLSIWGQIAKHEWTILMTCKNHFHDLHKATDWSMARYTSKIWTTNP